MVVVYKFIVTVHNIYTADIHTTASTTELSVLCAILFETCCSLYLAIQGY